MSDEREIKDLPDGWKRVRLGEVIELYDNKRIPLNEEERANRKGSYPYCGANGIFDYIDDYIFDGEYVLLAEDGGFFGKFENSAYIMKGKFWVNNHAHILKAKEEISINRFILEWLVFDDISKYISGTTRQKLNQVIMKNILLPFPPLSEQQKIAEILETVDNAIEKTDKIIEKYKRIKQGLMQDLLTKGIDEKGNIRSEKTHKFKDSPLGRIPEEWEVMRLGEILRYKKGKPPVENITGKEIDSVPYLTPEYLRGISPPQYVTKSKNLVEITDNKKIILLWDGSNAGEFFWSKKGFLASTMVVLNLLDEALHTDFIYYALKSNEDFLKGQTSGSGIPHVDKNIFNSIPLPLPPLHEQQRIAEILTQADQTIEKEEQYKEKLERLKQGLMDDLLTGKVRVNHLIEEGVKNV